MAKTKKDETEVIGDETENIYTSGDELKVYKAKARQHIKYSGNHIKVGEVFEVKECDLDELRPYADIEEGE